MFGNRFRVRFRGRRGAAVRTSTAEVEPHATESPFVAEVEPNAVESFSLTGCRCLTPPFHFANYEEQSVGVDDSSWRYADVDILTCRTCGTKWLNYFFEHEAYRQSNQWYCAIIAPELVDSVTPYNAAEFIGSQPWYFYGGGYWRTTGRAGRGPFEYGPTWVTFLPLFPRTGHA